MFQFQTIQVATGSADHEGRLVLRDGVLVGVLVKLDDQAHGDVRGQWHFEATFADVEKIASPLFAEPEDAARWLDAVAPPNV